MSFPQRTAGNHSRRRRHSELTDAVQHLPIHAARRRIRNARESGKRPPIWIRPEVERNSRQRRPSERRTVRQQSPRRIVEPRRSCKRNERRIDVDGNGSTSQRRYDVRRTPPRFPRLARLRIRVVNSVASYVVLPSRCKISLSQWTFSVSFFSACQIHRYNPIAASTQRTSPRAPAMQR